MKNTENMSIKCFFDVLGFSKSKNFGTGLFKTVQENTPEIYLNIGNNKKIKATSENIERYKLKCSEGNLYEQFGKKNIPVSNSRISFVLDNVIISMKDDQYNGEVSIADYCITDMNGYYYSFLQPAYYGIRIDNGRKNSYFLNEKIDGGLTHEFFITVEGLIKEKKNDVIMFNNTEFSTISGKIVNQNDYPLSKAEIIISKGKDIVSYIITKDDGNYRFSLKNDIYDVRIRGDNQSVKIIKNFNFDCKNGFINGLSQITNLYSKSDWIYI